jgi:hypothetical protein
MAPHRTKSARPQANDKLRRVPPKANLAYQVAHTNGTAEELDAFLDRLLERADTLEAEILALRNESRG